MRDRYGIEERPKRNKKQPVMKSEHKAGRED